MIKSNPAGHLAPNRELLSARDQFKKNIAAVISPKTQYNLKNARSYFEEHLSVGDYYSEGQSIHGMWAGKGSEMLGLRGVVTRDAFLRLCDNLHPSTGKNLTQRRKTVRRGISENGKDRDEANRRVFYDFTISPPKSVSVLALIGSDRRIVQSHHRAVSIALRELESFASTRIRQAGQLTDRETGNVVAAVFRHDTSRSLDPHLHSHCIVFNATRDPVEKRWKALQNFDMLRAQKYVENVYYHALARDLIGFGYRIENHPRGDFRVLGVGRALDEKFSKRHEEIDAKTNELLIREPGKAGANLAAIRENIAHNERSRKIKDIVPTELRKLWNDQLSDEDRSAVVAVVSEAKGHRKSPAVAKVDEALEWAEEHLFDRKSVVQEHELWRHALEHERGCDMPCEEIRAATERREYIRDEANSHKVTTRETLMREWRILELVKQGRQSFDSLNANHIIAETTLDADQRAAVATILSSRDFVTLFRGGAGTGKSYALREVSRGLENAGFPVVVVAPQRQQVMFLAKDGFADVRTVAEFLARGQMSSGSVVILDEAGQLGAKQMLELLTFVRENGSRVIASGDTRQHGAVAASDALRAIEKYAGLEAAELKTIRRQDPRHAADATEREFIEQYRLAVKDAAAGKIEESFNRLEDRGAVVSCSIADQQAKLTEEYLRLASGHHSTVVVAQTWSEIHKVNSAVRAALKMHDLLGGDEKTVTALEKVDLSDAQKRDARFYQPGFLVALNRDCARFRKGRCGTFVAVTRKGVVLQVEDQIGTVPLNRVDRLTICRPHELALAAGDRLQLKANARTADGRRLVNGELVTVTRVDKDGGVALQDGRVLGINYRQFVRGYAVTSYASQGKTVDYVLFSDSAVKAATNRQQWYVTISRGRKGIRIFTSDKEQLRENAARSGDRELALDLVKRVSVPTRVNRSHAAQVAIACRRWFVRIMQTRRAAQTQREGVAL